MYIFVVHIPSSNGFVVSTGPLSAPPIPSLNLKSLPAPPAHRRRSGHGNRKGLDAACPASAKEGWFGSLEFPGKYCWWKKSRQPVDMVNHYPIYMVSYTSSTIKMRRIFHPAILGKLECKFRLMVKVIHTRIQVKLAGIKKEHIDTYIAHGPVFDTA